MWFRFRFTLFGREIWSFELDRDEGLEIFEEEEEDEEEEEEEEVEYEEVCWGDQVFRWGEPHEFQRGVFVP